MTFNWQAWIEKFIEQPGYNDAQAVISEATNPTYEVLGIHCLSVIEDNAQSFIYVAALDKDNNRQMNTEIKYNSGVSEPSLIVVDTPDKITSFATPNQHNINVWHDDGEGAFGLKPGYSYLIAFREVEKHEPEANLGGIQVTVNQKWIANLKPDKQGNVTFFVDIK